MVAEPVGAFLRDAVRAYDERTIVVIGHRATRYGLGYWWSDAALDDIVATRWEWREILIWHYQIQVRRRQPAAAGVVCAIRPQSEACRSLFSH